MRYMPICQVQVLVHDQLAGNRQKLTAKREQLTGQAEQAFLYPISRGMACFDKLPIRFGGGGHGKENYQNATKSSDPGGGAIDRDRQLSRQLNGQETGSRSSSNSTPTIEPGLIVYCHP